MFIRIDLNVETDLLVYVCGFVLSIIYKLKELSGKELLCLVFSHSSMIEPFYDTVDVGVVQTEMWSQKYLAMREHALSLPKFGTPTANSEVRPTVECSAMFA